MTVMDHPSQHKRSVNMSDLLSQRKDRVLSRSGRKRAKGVLKNWFGAIAVSFLRNGPKQSKTREISSSREQRLTHQSNQSNNLLPRKRTLLHPIKGSMPPRQLPNLINLILTVKLRLFPKPNTNLLGKKIIIRFQLLEVVPFGLADGAFVPSP